MSGSDDFTLFIWNPETEKQPIARLTGHQQPVNHISFSPDGRFFASASFDKKVKVMPSRIFNCICAHLYTPHTHAVYIYLILLNRYGMAGQESLLPRSQGMWELCTVWHGALVVLIIIIWIHSCSICHRNRLTPSCDCRSSDSRMLMSASKDSTIKLWEVKDFKNAKATLPGHADEVYALDWSPLGQQVASGSKDRTIKVW